LNKISKALKFSKTKKIASYIFIYGLVNKTIVSKLNADIDAQKAVLKETQIVIDNSAVNMIYSLIILLEENMNVYTINLKI